jgi:hypothetical protein
VVLGQAAVAHPVESELALQHAKDMFYSGPYSGLRETLHKFQPSTLLG